MNKIILLFGAFIFSAMFLFGCSSPECDCNDNPGSSGAVASPSSSSIVANPGSSSSKGGTIPGGQELVRKNIKLSVDSSYADLDGNTTTYVKADVASILDKIDLIAFCGTEKGWCENNSIYIPWGINLFWNRTEYIGSESVVFFEIPNDKTAIFENSTTYSQIYDTYAELVNIFKKIDPQDYIDDISIAIGKAFLISTSENNIRIVIIKAADAQSVDLEIIEIPKGN